jgi:hypothetical protein
MVWGSFSCTFQSNDRNTLFNTKPMLKKLEGVIRNRKPRHTANNGHKTLNNDEQNKNNTEN